MSEFNGTKGPWTIEPASECLSYLTPEAVKEGIIRHVIVGGEPEEYYLAIIIGDIEAADANARLVASAPALLAALEEMLEIAAESDAAPIDPSETCECEELCGQPLCQAIGCVIDKIGRARAAIASAITGE